MMRSMVIMAFLSLPVLVMFGTFESLGILIHRREIDIRLVEVREASGRQTYDEWFQWLYEQFGKREQKTPAIPTYIAFRG